MLDLRSPLSDIRPSRRPAPWRGHEHVKGWGVLSLPFDSGHVLALRVAPEGDFGPFSSVWHRDPMGRWSIYVDADRLDIACPRYFGAACEYTGRARIEVEWAGPASLRVRMDDPALEWELTASSTRLLDVVNAIGGALPLATWRPAPLIRARERLGRALGMGQLDLHATMPSGHVGTLIAARLYFIERSRASLKGNDLGRTVHLNDNPRIGTFPLPVRGTFVIGQGVWEILDEVEYRQMLRA